MSSDATTAAASGMIQTSIIIPAFNHHVLTRRCLEQVLGTAPVPSGVEVLVVDDGSDPPAADELGPFLDRVRVVRHSQNQGFGRTCNDGAAAANGGLLIFLNNDTLPQPGWLEALVAYAAAHPAAGAIGSKLLYPDQTVQHAGVVVCYDRYPRHIYAGFPADHPAVSKPRRYQIVTAACALFRREAFEAAGGFDIRFTNGYEDVDLCLRLGQLGYEVHYCPGSIVYHLESITRGDLPPSIEHNDRLYRQLWADRVKPDDVGYYVEDGLLQFEFGPGESYPAHLVLSPLLAVLDGERSREVERLLNVRARQTFELIKENIRLSTLLLELGHDSLGPAPADLAHGEASE